MPSPNLQIPHIAATDSNKYSELNTAISDFDSAYAGEVTVAYNPSTGFNFSAVYLGYLAFIFPSGTLGSAGATIIVPSHGRMFVVINQTGAPLTFMCGTGAVEAVISDSAPHVLYCDGANSVYQAS